jgi:hypothetical protein
MWQRSNGALVKTVKLKVSLEQATKTQRGSKGIALPFFNLDARWGGWSTPRPGRFTPGKDPATHCVGVWGVGSRADLDGCGKSRPHQDSIPGPSNP